MAEQSSVQRSFRLSARTAELLEEAVAAGSETRNALTDRLLGEALRLERHPRIRFRTGGSGARRAALRDSRLYVFQVIRTWRDEGRDVAGAAEYFALPAGDVQAAVEYYADFREDIDADEAATLEAERIEYERWERRQRALA